MPRRILRAVTTRLAPPTSGHATFTMSVEDVVWAMGSFCALNRTPFDSALLIQQFPPPHERHDLIAAVRALGLDAVEVAVTRIVFVLAEVLQV